MRKEFNLKKHFYKKQPKLLAMSTFIKTPEKHHRIVHLINSIGTKLHTYDDIAKEDDNGKCIIRHHVICYKDFFVLTETWRKPSLIHNGYDTQYCFQAITYQGKTICSEIEKWNEAKFLNGLQKEYNQLDANSIAL